MRTNKRIIRVLIAISLLFLALVTYLLWFNMFRAKDVYTNSYNKRQWESEQHVQRGVNTGNSFPVHSATFLYFSSIEVATGNTDRKSVV